jgi:2-desacetyl-2-hydroxyethyl bacteriochlorophyllide A dehydrogenase
MMKAALKVEPKPGIAFGQIPFPQLSPDEILIRVKAVGICGSDVHIYEWTSGYEHLAGYMPLVLGHEFAGEVADVGGRISGVKIGERVVYEGRSCGKCFYCNIGQDSLCEDRDRVGLLRKGGMAEYVVVDGRKASLRPIPAGVSFEEASMSKPTTEALHMVDEAGISLGDAVVVLGAGPMAATVAQAAKASGASPVIVTGLTQDRERLAIVRTLGADATIDVQEEDAVARVKSLTGGIGAAKVFEVSGSPQAFQQGLEMLRKGGTLIAFGIYPQPIAVDFTRRVVREMKVIRGVYGSSRTTWDKVLHLIASGQIKITPLITHRMPLERVDEGFRLCQEKKAMKVILLP